MHASADDEHLSTIGARERGIVTSIFGISVFRWILVEISMHRVQSCGRVFGSVNCGKPGPENGKGDPARGGLDGRAQRGHSLGARLFPASLH